MPPNEKSYIITATWRGLGMSRVPLYATARSHRKTSRTGNPNPSATARSVTSRCRWRPRIAAAASGAPWSARSGTAVIPSFTKIPVRLHELLVDRLRHVGQHANLLLLQHQLAIGRRALDEYGIDLPGQFDVWNGDFDRLALLTELLHRDLDHLFGMGHGVVGRLLVHLDDQFESPRILLDHLFTGRNDHVE